jgi:hypothetical protein
MPNHICRIHVEMAIQSTKAEGSSTLVTPPAFPLWMVDPTQVAQPVDSILPPFHQTVDGSTQSPFPVRGTWFLWLKSEYLSCSNQNPCTPFRWMYFRPRVALTMFAAASTQITSKAQVEIDTFRTSYVAVPYSGAAKIASCNYCFWHLYPCDWCCRFILYRLIIHHLSEKSR